MKKTEYFCNWCGEQVAEEDCIIVSIALRKTIDTPGLRPSDWKLVLHLHGKCVDGFLFASRQQLAIPMTEIVKRVGL